MPLYEYQCEACGNRFERIQRFSDPPVETCPVCSGAVRKLLSSPAIQFKGSGWYITDYAKKQPAADGTKAAPSTDGAASKDTGSSASSTGTSGTGTASGRSSGSGGSGGSAGS